MIVGLAHICFTVSNLEESIAFYQDKLGLLPAFDFINDKGERFGIYLHVGRRNFIELFKGNPEHFNQKQAYRHFCLEVDDIQSIASELRTRGVDISEIKMGSDNSWQAWLSDPDGNRIELHQYTPKSKQNVSLR
ncbi:VOC family protein [Candidatus Poribacteria bacterium]|nr:VOC family protein [Candidatus Poribacteria bacterium]